MSLQGIDPGRKSMFNSLLAQLLLDVPTIAHAVAMSADGLALAHSPGLTADRSDQLCAAVSGLVSLARSTAGLLEAGAHQYSMQVMEYGVLVVQPTPDGSALAALAPSDADPGQVAYHLADVAQRVGQAIAPGLRAGR